MVIIPPSAETTKELAKIGKEFGQTLGPAWNSLIGIANDTLDYFRATRRLRFLKSFKEKCEVMGFKSLTKEVAPNFLIPLVEQATFELDDDLQDVWATMLANAADAGSDIEMRTAYVAMLSQMTRFDVTVLSTLARAAHAHPEATYLVADQLPEVVGAGQHEGGKSAPKMRDDVEISLANLNRLGCLIPMVTWGGLSYRSVSLTILGKAFVKACSLPIKSATSQTNI